MRMRKVATVLAFIASAAPSSFTNAEENPIRDGIAAAWRGDGATAEAALRAAVSACAAQTDGPAARRVSCASGANVLAALVQADARLAEAEPLFRLAISQLDAGNPDHATILADALNGLAGVFADGGRWRDAEHLASRARRLWEKSSGPDCPEAARALMTLAEVRLAAGDVTEAERLLRRARRVSERPGASPVLRAAVHARRGLLWLAQGRYADAEPALEEALSLSEGMAGPEHPALVRVIQLLADCYRLRNRVDDASSLYERGVGIVERRYGASHPTLAPLLAGLAVVAERQGHDDRALALYARALAVVDAHVGVGDPRRAPYVYPLARLHARLHETDRAEVLYRQALDCLQDRRGTALYATVLEGLSVAYANAGRSQDLLRVRRELRSRRSPDSHRPEPIGFSMAATEGSWAGAASVEPR
jgi:tetratricopeptide (TPR) repeat protein